MFLVPRFIKFFHPFVRRFLLVLPQEQRTSFQLEGIERPKEHAPNSSRHLFVHVGHSMLRFYLEKNTIDCIETRSWAGSRFSMKQVSSSVQMLKGLYLDELVFVADKLSHDRENWNYDKRSKSSVRKAILSHVDEHSLLKTLKKSLGEEMPSGNLFPNVLQIEKNVLGPVGCLKSLVQRSRYEADTISNLFSRYIRGSKLLERVVRTRQIEVSEEVLSSALKMKGSLCMPTLVQLLLMYMNDKEISHLVNLLLGRKEIQIGITGLFEDAEYPWIITRYGITTEPEEEPIENLADLIGKYYDENELGPELKPYSGDFSTKLLAYCIKENPQTILCRLFGIPELRHIAKKLGFVSDDLGNISDAISLVLLGLGFNVPPDLTGASTYISNIEKCGRDLYEAREPRVRSGIMSQVFVNMERTLRDLVCFYASFLWRKKLKDLKSEVEDEMPDLGSRQISIKALDLFMRDKFKIKKAFERLGFGDFISLIKTINNASKESEPLRIELSRKLDKTYVLENRDVRTLDSISPFRASFDHAKDYPGDEKCVEILDSVLKLMKTFQAAQIYPMVMRISKEVSDEYGKSYAECLDENGKKWLLYTEEFLEPSRPYFFYSKTPDIAVNPVIVEKVF